MMPRREGDREGGERGGERLETMGGWCFLRGFILYICAVGGYTSVCCGVNLNRRF